MSFKDQIKEAANLKECPFCGAPANLVHNVLNIYCTNCPATMGTNNIFTLDSMEKLIEAWNSRNRESAAATILNVKELSRIKK